MTIVLYILLFIATVMITMVFADLLVLLIRYRIEMDEWKYPIDTKSFREWTEKQKKEK
jgi:hypothetical protein